MSLTTAHELEAIAATALAGLEDDPVLVTLDGDAANSAVSHRAVVLIQAPRTTYPTYHEKTHVWTVYLVASHPDPLDAWAQLDAMTDALRLALDVDEATPTAFQPPHGSTWPAMSLTLTTHHDI